MESVREYFLGITGAALVCAVVTVFFDSKNLPGTVIRMLAGIFLTLSVIKPWLSLRLESIWDITDDFRIEGSSVSAAGENYAREAISAGIKNRTEAYILDKANSLGAELKAEVTLSDGEIPVPVGVCLTGKVTPYEKSRLTQIIESDLGIPAEEQIWTG